MNTVAAGFPTTVNPIVQNNLVPVFVDVQVPTSNIDPSQLEPALSGRTRAIMIAHALGNPFDLGADFVMNQALWVGVYPGLSAGMIDYVIASLEVYCREAVHG